MGIKHFFVWFKKNFADEIQSVNYGDNLNGIDTLMLDMNGIFHNSAQKVYKYGNHKDEIKRIIRPKPVNIKDVYYDVCRTIDALIDVVRPSENIILCIDGPAPLAKQAQQRQRRFRDNSEKSPIFDSNCITPGTKFMDDLSKHIDRHIKNALIKKKWGKDVKVIFSNEKAPGEGEHKLINYIRKFGKKNETYCINGLDADLIMLAMGTHLNNFYILREDMYDHNNDFFFIDVGDARKKLIKMMKWNSPNHGCLPKNVINDFIFLCFTVGNDFLPNIPSVEILVDGIETLIYLYKSVASRCGHLTLYDNENRVVFIPEPVSEMFSLIGEKEKELFERIQRDHRRFPNELLNECTDSNYNVNIKKYKKLYTSKKLQGNTLSKCNSYLEGMQWVISYYISGVPDWKWVYDGNYAPFASDLAKVAKNYEHVSYPPSESTLPFIQLLSVLPPKSRDLLPKPLDNLLIDSDLVDYCPNSVDIDLSGKRMEWEGIVLLPMVDFNLVNNLFYQYKELVDERDLKRNIIGKTFIYDKGRITCIDL